MSDALRGPNYDASQAEARLPLLRRFLLLTGVLTLAFCGWDRLVDEWAWLSNLVFRALGSGVLFGLAGMTPRRLSAARFDGVVVALALLYSLYLVCLLSHLRQGLTLGMPCLTLFNSLCCFLLVRSRNALQLVPVLGAVAWASWRGGVSELALWSHLIVMGMSLGCAGLLARVFETTGRRQFALEHRLGLEARTDPLTGLLNRRALSQCMLEESERARRYRRPLSILLLDLDHFKQVNDRWGHDVGDEVLRHLAGLCSQSLRASDRVGRWGGEEFLVLLPETQPEEALALAERLRLRVASSPCTTRGAQTAVTISLGVTALSGDEAWESAYTRVDQALYAAKREGRNRSVAVWPEPA